jgi:hypothetical protein
MPIGVLELNRHHLVKQLYIKITCMLFVHLLYYGSEQSYYKKSIQLTLHSQLQESVINQN